MLSRLTYSFFEDIKEDKVFTKTSLGKPITMPGWAAAILQSIVADSAVVSESMKTTCGHVHVGDVVWLTGPLRLARVRLAVRVGAAREFHRFFAIVECFGTTPLGAWSADCVGVIVVGADAIDGLCCYVIAGGMLYV